MLGQEANVSISVENISLKELLLELEKKSDVRFSYLDLNLDSKKNISLNVVNESIETILNRILPPKGLEYSKTGNTFAIKKISQTQPGGKAKKITGMVKDDSGEPIIGATISVKGTTTGTITDASGKFLLEAPPNSLLNISYVGYKTLEISVVGRNDFQITLVEDNKLLDEVMVVGYGVQRKSVVTAAISSVKSQDLGKIAPSRIDNVLKGMVSGVSITQASGQPGDGSQVRIRGVGTINDSDPLYIVDGMPIGGGINYLNPSDVESVEILKDAASAAI